MKKYLLSPNCIIVQGGVRDTLCDLQREEFYLLEKGLSVLLKDKPFGLDIHSSIYQRNKSLIEDFIEKEVVFEIDPTEIQFFPDYQFDFDTPSIIHNAIIDINTNSSFLVHEILFQLNSVLCRHIEIRYQQCFNVGLFDILSDPVISTSIVETFDIYLPYEHFFPIKDFVIAEKYRNPKLHWFFIYDAPLEFDKDNYPEGFLFTSQKMIFDKVCGNISHFYFMINPHLFTESLHHNSCLNRKISIDTDGNIKNCPSMAQSFGNIKDTTLQEALDHPDFKKYWNVTKDQVQVCKDCEFRYICTDCRAYLENPQDMYSKPLKCGYDPYTGVWEEWSTNPLKQRAIDYYGMREILPELTPPSNDNHARSDKSTAAAE